MKKFFVTLLLAACAGLTLQAQSSVDRLKAMVRDNRVAFDYSLSSEGKSQVKASGSAMIDGDCYIITGNGFVVYCDGKTKWTVDGESKECYIENAGGTKDYLANPEEWLSKVKDLNAGTKTVTGKYTDPQSGDVLSFKFSSITTMPKSGSTEGFTLDPATLGQGWVTTDLR